MSEPGREARGHGRKKCVGWKTILEARSLVGAPREQSRPWESGRHLDLWSAVVQRDLTYHFTSIRMVFMEIVESDSVGEDVEKLGPLCIAGRKVK